MSKVQQPDQLFHNVGVPLDSTSQVNDLTELNDRNFVVPYVGKMVHVKSEHKIYVCSYAPIGDTAKWRPLFSDDGSAFYITNVMGSREEVFKIYVERLADGSGRIKVDYPD